MKGKGTFTLILCLWTGWARAQSQEDIGMILALTGCDSEEQLDAHEVEKLQDSLEHPVRINTAGISTLRSCGLFSAYQVASLIDYRSRHGDIMSMTELSSVDGFTPEKVAVLSPFISLEGGEPAHGSSSGRKGFCDITMKAGARKDDGTYGIKAKGGTGRSFTFGLGFSRPYSAGSAAPETFSGYVGWESSQVPVRIVTGNFNLRFGQGLALWNGMSMGGLSKISSFYKAGTGLSTSYSYNGSSSFRGIAGEYCRSRLRLTSAVIIPKLGSDGFSILPAVNIGWFGRNMTIAATHYLEYERTRQSRLIPDMKTSADMAACINGIDIFTETTFDWANAVAASLAGCTFPAWGITRMAAHVRYYPARYNAAYSAAARSGSKCSNELGASYCLEITPESRTHEGSISLDAAYLPESKGSAAHSIQLKASAGWQICISEQTELKVRLTERFRTWESPGSKTEIRTDFTWTGNRLCISSRLDVVMHVRTGFLGYAEGGYKTEKLAVYLKGGIYLIDEWEDRIYSYERNGPGNFSVPAFYGRGLWATLYTAWKFSSWGKAYLIGTVKPGKAELKLQCMFSF